MVIMVHGACGYMGREVLRLLAGSYPDTTVVPVDVGSDCPDVYRTPQEFSGKADCIIDFSHHSATKHLLAYATATKTPLVLATTGQTEEELAAIEAASVQIPLFFSSNMSLGVAELIRMAKEAARAFPDADIEIVEAHHNRKLDVPSGTALTIAKQLQTVRPGAQLNIGRHEDGRRKKEEIGIHSLRMGNVVGTHEVILSTPTQTLTLRHEAHDRKLFAEGAVAAAMFLMGKPAGMYGMNDIL